VRFEQPAQETMLLHCGYGADPAADRLGRLARAITDAVALAPLATRTEIDALQALRRIALTSAVTNVAGIGALARLTRACELIGRCGVGLREASSSGRM